MISRLSQSLLLSPNDLQPSRDEFEVVGVFNPGVVRIRSQVVMLVRVAEKPIEKRGNVIGLPRWNRSGDCIIDWVPRSDWTAVDPRVVQSKSTGVLRLTSTSHLRVFRMRDGSTEGWMPGTALLPETPTEAFGMEDPRITLIDSTYWITYVAVSGKGAATAIASSKDMVTFERHGLIFCPENKDVVLFSQPIDDQYVALHRPNPNSSFGPPQIWIARSPDLLHWGRYQSLYQGQSPWESDRVGGGTPPLLIDEGWLHFYHGSRRDDRPGRVGDYSAGALLLDRSDPARVLARTVQPIMAAETEYERCGFVPQVVFPTAAIQRDHLIDVYYGAADTSTAIATFAKQDILNALC